MLKFVTDIFEVLAGGMLPLLAVFGAYIAWRQYKVSHQRILMDLYEKRFSVYQAWRDLDLYIYANASVSVEELRKFKVGSAQAVFLFPESSGIVPFLKSIQDRATDLRCTSQRLSNSSQLDSEKLNALADQDSEILRWLAAQDEVALRLFAPFLRMPL